VKSVAVAAPETVKSAAGSVAGAAETVVEKVAEKMPFGGDDGDRG
jgi:hypothetical protein